LLDRPIGTLSGGQQKVFIARALVRRPKLLFLDEPFASLDRESREPAARVVREDIDKKGATVLVVSHDTSPIASLADATVRMNGGRGNTCRGRTYMILALLFIIALLAGPSAEFLGYYVERLGVVTLSFSVIHAALAGAAIGMVLRID